MPAALAADFARDGFVVVRGAFAPAEVAAARAAFFALPEAGRAIPGLFHAPEDAGAADPLARWPRVMQPHAHAGLPVGPIALGWMLDPRLTDVARALLDEEPVGVQTMFYFKPPGARGQAFHQDNYYLQARPKPCLAAWIAIDRADAANGALALAAGSHRLPILPVRASDLGRSFVDVQVDPPPGATLAAPELEPGDMLFFDGNLIHGSEPNRSADRFRASFIAHYVASSTRAMSPWYKDCRRPNGTRATFAVPDDYVAVGMAAAAMR